MGAEAGTIETVKIKKQDLEAGLAVFEKLDTVERWSRRGKRADEIEMEIPNVIQCAMYRKVYQDMRDKLLSKYGIKEESTLVRCLMSSIASR
jgi:hypothetical protein